ncbi:MAG: peptide-methionine (S)-S-oxide reductase MsrA [Deltaproteobacteria bacterium]|nr:peptide-methionine (S)-S-oxide reductase MsrA [Deltaproteobacteria bacterium]
MGTQKAVFAAGCFWGVEEAFRELKGVVSTRAGYTGGETENPSYKDVSSGKTGHTEAVMVEFDPAVISYNELLDLFWEIHDPTTLNRQGPDIGEQYKSAIFTLNREQEAAAGESKKRLDRSGIFSRPVTTEIKPAGIFYEAEEYHQQYLHKRGLSHC